jgi:hypothetical protein
VLVVWSQDAHAIDQEFGESIHGAWRISGLSAPPCEVAPIVQGVGMIWTIDADTVGEQVDEFAAIK